MNTSPTRVVMKALTAAWRGVIWVGSSYLRAYQKPMSKYEHRPMISQPMNMSRRLSATTSVSIPKANRERKAKKREYIGSMPLCGGLPGASWGSRGLPQLL